MLGRAGTVGSIALVASVFTIRSPLGAWGAVQ
jgi:hypothetical protein